jgi:adenine-specific DNA methylase
MKLSWHNYRYFPYEHELAARELASLLGEALAERIDGGLQLSGVYELSQLDRLTYFSSYANGHGATETVQSRLEKSARPGNRQATRYSVHGLHEYKGKFNPQVARAILNVFNIRAGDRVLDPFCGSGTTLVECSHLSAIGRGTDLNPFAVFIANVKLQMLGTPGRVLRSAFNKIAREIENSGSRKLPLSDDPRGEYLQSWFDESVLRQIETLAHQVRKAAGKHSAIFLAIMSNLLRDYSLQEPGDLRIRRRSSPMPSMPFVDAFMAASNLALSRLEAAQDVLGHQPEIGLALLKDIRTAKPGDFEAKFDAAVTSPPYAMALPYIDTQRLSLVWLGLLPSDRILQVESDLIGSREFRGRDRKKIVEALVCNIDDLPKTEAGYCVQLQEALNDSDGFRRRAVPTLLYRYFGAMRDSFASVSRLLKPDAPFALIVGHNRTTLGGNRFDINTPRHLANLAQSVGWEVAEEMPMQTYQRYGLHSENAVEAETLLILKNCGSSPER